MKIQSGAIDGAITADFSDSIADMPELLGEFLPMLLALPTQCLPDEMAGSLENELFPANESEQHLPVDFAKDVDNEANLPTASMELMAMLDAAVPLPVKPDIIDDKESLSSVISNLNGNSSTPLIMPIPVFKSDMPSAKIERDINSNALPSQSMPSQLPIINPLPESKAASAVFVLPDKPIAEVLTAPVMALVKQSATAMEPITKKSPAIDGITPVVADKPSELHLCQTVLTTTVDFFNKQLITIENSAPVASQAAPNIAADGQVMREKKIALEAFQCNLSQLESLNSGNYCARIKVYPPDAGQITADILIHKGTADVTLRCDNPGVKQFLETHLQPLRESFLQSTLQLGDVLIQHQSTGSEASNQQTSHQSAFADYYAKEPEENALGGSVISNKPHAPSSHSMIDAWV